MVVVDNGSDDGSFEFLAQALDRFPKLEESTAFGKNGGIISRSYCLQNKSVVVLAGLSENSGFAGGMNRAIEIASHFNVSSYFLLNNDAEISIQGIRELKHISIANDDALVGPIVKSFENREQTLFAGKRWPQILYGFDMLPINFKRDIWDTGYIEGSALFLPGEFVRSMLAKNGYVFDERYFLYCEDVDLCLNAKRLGHKCLVTSRVTAFHKVSASSGGLGSPTAYYYITRNRILLAKKWFPLIGYYLFCIYHVLTRAVIAGKRAIRGNSGYKINKIVFKAIFDGVLGRYGRTEESY
nr:hypothetical protein HAGR004_14970 [Bdellovibrio sp. HAGR004]